MKISILVEGKTERVFIPYLRKFLESRISGNMPKLDPVPFNGRIPKENALKRCVLNLLTSGQKPADAVIAITDVYTGNDDFLDAQDAKDKMRTWVGKDEMRFHPHAAQHDFEAWLLPYWPQIQRLSGSNRVQPNGNPESVNHGNPPSRRINDVFMNGKKGKRYVKERDALRILREVDLSVSISACPELKSIVNTILSLCGSSTIH